MKKPTPFHFLRPVPPPARRRGPAPASGPPPVAYRDPLAVKDFKERTEHDYLGDDPLWLGNRMS